MWEEVAPVDQNGIITMYEVLYVPLETFGEVIQDQMIDIPVTNMSVLLMDLEEYVDYFISIRAYTSVGEGPYSQGMIIRTQENSKIMIYSQTEQKRIRIFIMYTVPDGSPDNVTGMANSSTTIIVTWDSIPPIDQNGIITMYEVLYQPLETFGGAIGPMTRNVSGTEMSVVLMDLQEFVSYNITVRAYTSVGEGPYSTEISVATLQDGMLFFNILNFN